MFFGLTWTRRYIIALFKMGDQLDLGLKEPHGGARTNAGRKKSATRHDSAHRMRPELSRHVPIHVVLRTRHDVGRLRCEPIYHAIRRALMKSLGRADFRVVHVSIQHSHVHFLVEADDKQALRLGMQGLAIAAARAINRSCGRRGKVFAFRYHATQIRSPRQARHALSYVLNNWRRHCEDASGLIDRYSSAITFWTFDIPNDYEILPVARPQSWLLRVGWQRHGPIGYRERPG
jgi:REP element-mobilizing transposase RayT